MKKLFSVIAYSTGCLLFFSSTNLNAASSNEVTQSIVSKLASNCVFAVGSSKKIACVIMPGNWISFVAPKETSSGTPLGTHGDWMLTSGFMRNDLKFMDVKSAGLEQEINDMFDLYDLNGIVIEKICVSLDKNDRIINLRWIDLNKVQH